jgi:hypothetical protein
MGLRHEPRSTPALILQDTKLCDRSNPLKPVARRGSSPTLACALRARVVREWAITSPAQPAQAERESAGKRHIGPGTLVRNRRPDRPFKAAARVRIPLGLLDRRAGVHRLLGFAVTPLVELKGSTLCR